MRKLKAIMGMAAICVLFVACSAEKKEESTQASTEQSVESVNVVVEETVATTPESTGIVESEVITETTSEEVVISEEEVANVVESQQEASEDWKVAFEKSLFENYGVIVDHYEDIGDGYYRVYVDLDGEIVPYVTVDSATGDYHG